MIELFAERMNHTPKSFIREILKVAADPDVISFAGGLPNPSLFPVQEIAEASTKVLKDDGRNVLQYTTTEGYLPLREFIADRYFQKYGLHVSPDEILITNGSQQCLDLLGKVFLNDGDSLVIEKPGYLGAIQAFSIYCPQFHSIPLKEDGIHLEELENVLKNNHIKLFYAVTNFQNPSGISYSDHCRKGLASQLERYPFVFAEDNPYGELRFMGEDLPPIRHYCEERTLLMGSFSKTVVPAFRMGWICAKPDIMEKLIVAKQASDLHTNSFSQRVLYQFLHDNDIDAHIARIKDVYRKQRQAMVNAIEQYLPQEVKSTKPEGGMFLWLTLPNGYSSAKLIEAALQQKVAFVPGFPFYVDGGGDNAMRLNFSNVDEDTIFEGMRRIQTALETIL